MAEKKHVSADASLAGRGVRVCSESTASGSGDDGTFLECSEIARRLHCSPNHVMALAERGLLPVVRLGRRTLYPWPVWQLRALGLSDPAALGSFCKALGIGTLTELLAFLMPPNRGAS